MTESCTNSACVTSDSHQLVLLQLQHVDVSFGGLILIYGEHDTALGAQDIKI